jgi:hypothetical protein
MASSRPSASGSRASCGSRSAAAMRPGRESARKRSTPRASARTPRSSAQWVAPAPRSCTARSRASWAASAVSSLIPYLALARARARGRRAGATTKPGPVPNTPKGAQRRTRHPPTHACTLVDAPHGRPPWGPPTGWRAAPAPARRARARTPPPARGSPGPPPRTSATRPAAARSPRCSRSTRAARGAR